MEQPTNQGKAGKLSGRLRKSVSLNYQEEQSTQKKQCCLARKLRQIKLGFLRFSAGRNGIVVQFQIFLIIFKFFYGLFDQISDWYYYFYYMKVNKFASETVSDLMLFFLVAQVVIQIIAWAIILGQLNLSKPNMNLLRDVEQATSNEKSIFKYAIKFIYFTIRNYFFILLYSIMLLPHAILMTFFQLTKTSPYLIHGFFAFKYNIILTRDLMKNLTIEQRKQQLEEKQNIKIQQQKHIMSKYIKQKILDKTIDAAEIQKKELQWQQNSQAKASKDEEDTQHEQIVESNILSDNLLNAIALDANMTPNLQTFFYEADIEKYQKLSDTIQALFEALPLAILQYVNNEEFKMYKGVNNWDSIWTVLTFATSCLTISVYCINLIRELFQEDATVLWSQWQKLEDIAAESYFGAHGEKKTLAQTYQLPQEFTISKKDDILKLQNLQEKSIKKFKKLRFLLGDYGADAPYLVESFEYICPRLRCQELQLDFGGEIGNDLNQDHLYICLVAVAKFVNNANLDNHVIELKLAHNHFTMTKLSSQQKRHLEKAFHSLKVKTFTLKLDDCQMQDDDFVYVLELFQSTNIINLHLFFNKNRIGIREKVVDNGLFNQKIIYENSQLKGLEAMTQMNLQTRLNQLTLDLSYNMLNDTGVRNLLENYVAKFVDLNGLCLSFQGNYLSDEGDFFKTQLQGKTTIDQLALNFSDQQVVSIQKSKLFIDLASRLEARQIEALKNNPVSTNKIRDIENPGNQQLTLFGQTQSISTEYQPFREKKIPLIADQFVSQYQKVEVLKLSFSNNQLAPYPIAYLNKNCLSQFVGSIHQLYLKLENVRGLESTHFTELLSLIEKMENLNTLIIDLQKNQVFDHKMLGENRIIFQDIMKMSNKYYELSQEDEKDHTLVTKQNYVVQILTDLAELSNQYFVMQMCGYQLKLLSVPSFQLQTMFYMLVNNNQITHIMECMFDDQVHQGMVIRSLNKVQVPNLAQIGRFNIKDKNQVKDITFNKNDDTVSRNQVEIKYAGAPLIRCVQDATNPLFYYIGYQERYQIYEGVEIQLGQGAGSIQLQVLKLSKNTYLDDNFYQMILQQNQARAQKKQLSFRQFYRCDRLNPQLLNANNNQDEDDEKTNPNEDSATETVNQEYIQAKDQNQNEALPDGYIEIQMKERPDTLKKFLLKPGQKLTIGKGNDCDFILDPPREEERVIADLHFLIGFDTLEQHTIPQNDEKKICDGARINQCRAFMEQFKSKKSPKASSGHDLLNPANYQLEQPDQINNQQQQAEEMTINPYFFIERLRFDNHQSNQTFLLQDNVFQQVSQKQKITIGFSHFEFKLKI